MKKFCLFLALFLTFTLLVGCGASAADTAEAEYDMGYAMAAGEAPAEEAIVEEAVAETMAEAPVVMAEEDSLDLSDGLVTVEVSQDLSEKIIYSAYAEIETTTFEESLDSVSKLLSQYGGFIESSSVTGSDLQSDYYGYSSYRTATYTLRIPRENYGAVTSGLSAIGNVIYLSSDATNITTQYTDTASRLAAYETEETRLLEILSQADTVEDMITVESRLSEIRYEIENLTSLLTNWDNQISYSTISLYIQEVEIYTPTPAQELTYWEEVGQAVNSTLHWMASAGKTLFKVFIAALPVLVPLAILMVVIVVVIRRKKKSPSPSPSDTADNS